MLLARVVVVDRYKLRTQRDRMCSKDHCGTKGGVEDEDLHQPCWQKARCRRTCRQDQ